MVGLTVKLQTSYYNEVYSSNVKPTENQDDSKSLTKDAANTLALGLVISHLDYCNAILVGLPDTDISCLQRIQNICAKTVLG